MSAKDVSDTWERGSPYERYIGRWSRLVAPRFLDWLGAPAGRRWVDVGCGTGALCAAILDRGAPADVVGVEPSAGFLETADRNLAGRARLLAGHASQIPLPDASRDVVVSGLVLNFVPDLTAALAELRRVAVPGGTVAAYVWDYADGMALIRAFWDAAVSLDPSCAHLHEGNRFPLCTPSALQAAFETGGLTSVRTSALELDAVFDSFEDYWQPFLGGQGPAPAYVMSLAPDARAALRDHLRATMPVAADGRVTVGARAWAVRGTVPQRA